MELLDGRDLRELAPLPVAQACRVPARRRLVARAAARAPPAAPRPQPAQRARHRRRALQAARLRRAGQLRHAPRASSARRRCVPPEALQRRALDQRADLYALGALAYWLLTRQHAYPARTLDELPELWERVPAAAVEPLMARHPARSSTRWCCRCSTTTRSRGRQRRRGDRAAQRDRRAAAGRRARPRGWRRASCCSPRSSDASASWTSCSARIDATCEGDGGAIGSRRAPAWDARACSRRSACMAQLAGAHGAARRRRACTGSRAARCARCAPLLDALPRRGSSRHAERASARFASSAADGQQPASPLLIAPQCGPGIRARSARSRTGSRGQPDPCRSCSQSTTPSTRTTPAWASLASSHASPQSAACAGRARTSSIAGRRLVGLAALRAHCTRMTLSRVESRTRRWQLARSLFGDAPNVARFADWLHARTAGSPLHCRRDLPPAGRAARDPLHEGIWTLPAERPDAGASRARSKRRAVARASTLVAARRAALAECLSLHSGEPTLELCMLLAGTDVRPARCSSLLDELARNDVLLSSSEGLPLQQRRAARGAARPRWTSGARGQPRAPR